MTTVLAYLSLALSAPVLALAICKPGGVGQLGMAVWGVWALMSFNEVVTASGTATRIIWLVSACEVTAALVLESRAMRAARTNASDTELENQR